MIIIYTRIEYLLNGELYEVAYINYTGSDGYTYTIVNGGLLNTIGFYKRILNQPDLLEQFRRNANMHDVVPEGYVYFMEITE